MATNTKKAKAAAAQGAGAVAYEAFRESLGGADLMGPMPEHAMLANHVKAAWDAAAAAVLGAPTAEAEAGS